MRLEGYEIGERVYASQSSHVYRAVDTSLDRPVYIKSLPEELPPPSKLTRLRREYRLTRRFEDDHVIHTLGLEQIEQRLFMVVEDFGGLSLDRALHSGTHYDVATRLRIAIGAAGAVAQTHERGIIHKDISPANLVWNRKTDQVKVIDFGISTALPHETPNLGNPHVVEGTLAFISPEQTGRINRILDYRTDLYSLGATLYWVFTGALPFATEDAIELVHCHVARMPVAAHVANPDVPEVISNIITKLLAKAAEDRYQNATSLKSDLQTCLAQQETGAINTFELESTALSERF